MLAAGDAHSLVWRFVTQKTFAARQSWKEGHCPQKRQPKTKDQLKSQIQKRERGCRLMIKSHTKHTTRNRTRMQLLHAFRNYSGITAKGTKHSKLIVIGQGQPFRERIILVVVSRSQILQLSILRGDLCGKRATGSRWRVIVIIIIVFLSYSG